MNSEANTFFGHEAMERDMESSYMNYGARLYDPKLGRFLSVDPLWQAFPSLTPYQYAFNSPISYKDPTGLAPQKEKGEQVQGGLYGSLPYSKWSDLMKSQKSAEAWEDAFASGQLALMQLAGLGYSMMGFYNDGGFNLDYGYGGGGSGGGRDGKNESGNGIGGEGAGYSTNMEMGKRDEYGVAQLFINYSIQIPISGGNTLNIPISVNDLSVANYALSFVMDTVEGINIILAANPEFFDSGFGQDLRIIVDSDKNIASIYNQEGHSSSVLTGLHQPTNNGANIYIASQVYGRGSDMHRYQTDTWLPRHYSKNNYMAWEVLAHEFGHNIDMISFGNFYKSLPNGVKEGLAIEHTNFIRYYYGMKPQIKGLFWEK